MTTRTLRAVPPPSGKPARKSTAKKAEAKPKTVTKAAEDGDARGLLVAMRDRIAIAVEDKNTPARDLAALSKRLMEIQRDIEAFDARAAEEAKEHVAIPDEAWNAEAL